MTSFTFAYLTIRMNLFAQLSDDEYMSSYLLKIEMGDSGLELKYAHVLDIETVWPPGYLGSLTAMGARPDPIMLYSGLMLF